MNKPLCLYELRFELNMFVNTLSCIECQKLLAENLVFAFILFFLGGGVVTCSDLCHVFNEIYLKLKAKYLLLICEHTQTHRWLFPVISEKDALLNLVDNSLSEYYVPYKMCLILYFDWKGRKIQQRVNERVVQST